MTKKILERIKKDNERIALHLEYLKTKYKVNQTEYSEIEGYLTGLMHCGFITAKELHVLTAWFTL